jgi:hypothetical protein
MVPALQPARRRRDVDGISMADMPFDATTACGTSILSHDSNKRLGWVLFRHTQRFVLVHYYHHHHHHHHQKLIHNFAAEMHFICRRLLSIDVESACSNDAIDTFRVESYIVLCTHTPTSVPFFPPAYRRQH